eukprot:5640800-Ditylum_brightwellii.AAC.1
MARRSSSPSPSCSFYSNNNHSNNSSDNNQEEQEEKKRVLVPIANGSEEIETACITDTLSRFGAHVMVASVVVGGNGKKDGEDERMCTMSRGMKARVCVCVCCVRLKVSFILLILN